MVSRRDESARVHAALIELCFERGFANLTVEDLCRRAGIDRAAFDRRYANLTDCFIQIHQAEWERYERIAAQARDGLTSWRDRIRATAYAIYRFLAEDEKAQKFNVVEARAAGERPQLLLGQEIGILVDLIDEGRQELADPDSLSRSTAEQLTGGIFNQIYTTIGRGGTLPPASEIVPQLMYAVVLPYLGEEAALEELSIPAPPAPN
jgi:AcrR family transcriptional regulator